MTGSLHGRQRIMVIGSSGAGKSTFARALAARTGLPLIHLDQYFWKPGWTPTPGEEWIECVRHLSDGDAWIIDGNYRLSLSIRAARCDAVVFFDLPRTLSFQRIFMRWLKGQFATRPDLADGCPERLSLEFLRWVWNYPRDSRPAIAAVAEQAAPGVHVETITRRRQTQRILGAISISTRATVSS